MSYRVAALAVLATICCGCNVAKGGSSEAEPFQAQSISRSSKIPTTGSVVSTALSQANPHRDSYQAWDELLIQNVSQVSEGPDHNFGRNNPGLTPLEGILDTKGFLLPRAEMIRQKEQFLAAAINMDRPFGEDRTWVYASVQMNQTTFKAMEQSDDKIALEFLPDLPQWLATKNFFAATVLPDGKVILDHKNAQRPPVLLGEARDPKNLAKIQEMCRERGLPVPGEYGDAHSHSGGGNHHASHSTNPRYELFSPQGDLLASTSTHRWWGLFGNESPAVDGWDRSVLTPDGYWLLKDSVTDKTVAVLDFDGRLIDTLDPPARSSHAFATIRKARILRLINLQR